MERFRLRRSQDTARAADHCSSSFRVHPGNGQVSKQRKFSKLNSDSSFCSSTSTGENSFACELGRKSSKQGIVMPIKKLLAEEMARETECKRRSPSVIVRLMGLDGLPSPQLSLKQQKKSSMNQLHKMTSSEKAQKHATLFSRGPSRKSSKEEQEFKDVYEVLDASQIESSSYSSRRTTDSKLTEAQMTFIEQRFMQAKRLSTDEKFQDSKEFCDVIEDLESNNDVLLKFLQQPDSLFTKHLHDLQGAPPLPLCGHISARKSSDSADYEPGGIGRKIERETTCKSRRKRRDVFSQSHSERAAQHPIESSNIQLHGKDITTILPSRIVVLKPNIGKMQNTTRPVMASHSSHNFLSVSKKQSKHLTMDRESDLCRKKKFPDDVGPSRYKSGESREIAKEITKQMRNSLKKGSRDFSACGFRGYAGDESSSNRSENESVNESEVTMGTSRTSIDLSIHFRPSSSHSTESSVSREARKRLSERWKMTHRSVDMGVISRGSTLGEMLAIPDREVRSPNSDVMISESGFRDKVDGNDDGRAEWIEPLGISSGDGWKDSCISNLPRSRSVPASSTATSSPNIGTRRETLCNERYMIPKESMPWERDKAVKGKIERREGPCSRNLRSRYKKSHISRCAYSDHSDASSEINFGNNQVQSNIIEVNQLKQSHTISMTSSAITDVNSFSENVVDAAIESVAIQIKPTDPDSSAYMVIKRDSSAGDLDVSSSQEPSIVQPERNSVSVPHPVTGHESPASSKDADQPSPVSVLETPFPDDLSSGSECFESVSADLHGLRMQLQLLKLESETYAEGSMLISSDEDVEKGSVGFPEERRICEESKELSYIMDVLLDAGINNADADTFMATWHSPECPVSPLVFEELEKKYCDHTSWPRSERRLLFDRINSAILVINQQYADPRPWVRPATRVALSWTINGLGNSLHDLLAIEEKKANKVAAGNVLSKESEWLDLGEDIDAIGCEIEKFLLEELANELEVM